MAYWGKLPPVNVTRGDSMKRANTDPRGEPLTLDTNPRVERLSGQSTSRRNRDSTQTEASTASTFVSPTASSFRGDGLAPRPASYQQGTGEAVYNKDYQEKRRQREARNKVYDETPPPAAPDAPRAPPPVSYKAPYGNGGYAPPTRTSSTRKADAPISDEEYYGRDGYRESGRRSSRGKGVDKGGEGDMRSPVSEAEEKRRREWAADRSPLQRLELTLDSITKEEKRARVEEAELLAREGRSGQGGERSKQNSVRFRNRPVAKAPDASQAESEEDFGLVRSPIMKDQVPRHRTMEGNVPPSPRRQVNDYEPREAAGVPVNSSVPQRKVSTRDRSAVPLAAGAGAAAAAVATGVGRSKSNKLRKDPPGDPWFNRRAEAERELKESGARRESVGDIPRHQASQTRGPAPSSRPQVKEKNLPSLPKEAHSPTYPHNNLELESDEDVDVDLTPMRRGNSRKIEQLTGERGVGQDPKTAPASHIYGEKTKTDHRARVGSQGQPGNQVGASNGGQNTIKLVNASELKTTRQPPQGHHHHLPHLSNMLHHRHDNGAGQSAHISTRRFDEWKTGGVVMLDGALLDLDTKEQTEAEKDKAWWEAGNKGQRRRSSTTKERKAVAYDGEFDESTGIVPPIPQTVECEGCAFEKGESKSWQIFQARLSSHQRCPNEMIETDKGRGVIAQTLSLTPSESSEFAKLDSPISYSSLQSNKFLNVPPKKHSLTRVTRAFRVKPNIAPTRFKPPLFLKCGPLLRYCGLRKETKQGRVPRNAPRPEREIWRGSVMIVTQDSHSSYDLAPTLRLFAQPTDLLPPPPAQVDGEMEDIAPEYVDPIGGLPKIGRDGRTLYIRPVEHLEEARDLSKEESDDGLFEAHKSPADGNSDSNAGHKKSHYDGEKAGKYKEIRGFRLHAEFGVTFWKFNIEVELRDVQQRIAYRINRGPATGFWIPAKGQGMNIMFHSCNGFSYGVDPNAFSGPDPMWRDVLNTHQTQPFHVMLGGGDQIYNDAVQRETTLFHDWTQIREQNHKEHQPFTAELQEELERFYLNRYSMWFSQGLFGLANSQIPMVNLFDDHDIIDGFGSYSDRYMRSAVMSGLGAVAFKYYMLFQQQSSIDEGEDTEPTWVLGTQPGPYIPEMSRSILTFLGRSIAFLGIDCRTERMYDEVVSPETYDKIFARLEDEIVKGETKHLIVLLGVPIAYPRMVWLENILTSRLMEPVKALGRAGLLGKGLLNHLDGGVEILDDLDDHWTAKHHKDERAFLIEELQELAAEKSVRITILGGDVHLAAIGQFYSNPKLGIPKDRDHRYMPNVISSAIVNTPPPDALADLLNKRNKIHHLDEDTDENMIPIFAHDVNGKARNNKRLLNRRNWCSIREYNPELTPPPTPEEASYEGSVSPPPVKRGGLLRRFSRSGGPTFRPDASPVDRPPLSNTNFFSRKPSISRRSTEIERRGSIDSQRPGMLTRTLSLTRKDFLPKLFQRNKRHDDGGINGYGSESGEEDDYYDDHQQARSGLRGGGGDSDDDDGYFPSMPKPMGREPKRPIGNANITSPGGVPQSPRGQFHRTPTGLSQKQLKTGNHSVNLEGGLDICLNVEVNPKDPAGITMPYRLLVPRLWYEEEAAQREAARNMRDRMKKWSMFAKKGKHSGRWHEQDESDEEDARYEMSGGARGL